MNAGHICGGRHYSVPPCVVTRALIVFLVCSGLMSGCITTRVDSYTDPAFSEYSATSIVVCAPNSDLGFAGRLEEEVARRLANRGLDAWRFIDMFPPTRRHTQSQVTTKLKKHRIASLLVIRLTDEDSGSDVAYIHQSGTATVQTYGNTVYGSASGYTIPVRTPHRSTETSVSMQDIATGKTVWIGETRTSAGGALYTSDSSTISSLASSIVRKLIADGVIPPAGPRK